ncbi:MAG: glycosyltransferase [Actinobacteria bacterium]|nr:glycosyltransferase [Actinomycetota bacterium]
MPSARIEELLDRIERQRQVVDPRLLRTARWRGPIRRELLGREAPDERARVAATFDRLAAEALGGRELDLELLLRIHAEAAGGGEFRRGGVTVGPPSWPRIGYPAPRELPGLVGHSLERAGDGVEPPVLEATRLHLELLLIHPFSDGNGRTARLASAFLLMRAGFRSTLLTAVEQHFHAEPGAYPRAFRELVEGGALDQEPWLFAALSAMAGNSALATWRLERDGVPRRFLNRWRREHPRAAAEMDRQLQRIADEEADERAHPSGGASRPIPVAPPAVERAPAEAEGRAPVATVVVPAWRAADTIAACLRALRGQELAEPFEVVVVASGPDATADIVRRGFPEVRLLRSAGRLSPGAARNAGVARARGAIVAFLAADCMAEPSWLRRRVEAHRDGHELVGGFIDSAEPSTLAGWAQYVAKFWGLLGSARLGGVGRGPLFHLSYRREVLERFGPFPEGTVAGEDTAYNHAIVAAGVRVFFDPAIRVRHVNARTWREVRDGQREQGAAAGDLCRTSPVARYFTHWVRGGPLGPVFLALRATTAVARHRPRSLPRTIAAFPLILGAVAVRWRAFRRAYRGSSTPVGPKGGAVTPVPPVEAGEPLVSIVVAAYDEERLIARCVDSLLAQTHPALEVIVVDDGSTDRTAEIAEGRAVRVIRVPHRGPARARNAGAGAARGEVVVFVDADLELDEACIERLAAPILRREVVGTFTKDMWVANPEEPWAACWTINRGFPPGHAFPPRFPDTWSNFRAVRRDAFLGVGGYDDVGYGEDMSLASKLGTLAVAVPGARMWHHNPSSLPEIWANAVWIGRGVRIRELDHVWRRYAPWCSLARGVRTARRSGRPRFVPFKLFFDAGVLAGYAASHVRPARHWK